MKRIFGFRPDYCIMESRNRLLMAANAPVEKWGYSDRIPLGWSAEDSAGCAAGIQTEPDHVVGHGRRIIGTGKHIIWRVLSGVLMRQSELGISCAISTRSSCNLLLCLCILYIGQGSQVPVTCVYTIILMHRVHVLLRLLDVNTCICDHCSWLCMTVHWTSSPTRHTPWETVDLSTRTSQGATRHRQWSFSFSRDPSPEKPRWEKI